jgi:hypothetical protein
MSSAKFYHVYILPNPDVDMDSIETKMNLALDWIKYGKCNWVVYSNASMDQLMSRFKPLADPHGQLFICELNTTMRNGWMSQSFWNWLKKERNN